MSNSNDNNSANNQITQGLDIESEADASMNIATQQIPTVSLRNSGNFIVNNYCLKLSLVIS